MSSDHSLNHLGSIRTAVFDLGAVLFTPHPLFTPQRSDILAHLAQRLGVMPDALQARLWHGPDIEAANVGAITAEEYCRRCGVRLGADELLVRALIEDAFSGERLNDQLVDYIRTLRPCIRVAALTNNWSFGRTLIERRGISDLFDTIIISAEEGICKPQPRIYEIMLERLEMIPEQAIFVDDSAENGAAARRLGIYGIQFRCTAQTIAELNALLR